MTWINIKDRLPKPGEFKFVVGLIDGLPMIMELDKNKHGLGSITIDEYGVKRWTLLEYARDPTHWMPLPELPEKDGT